MARQVPIADQGDEEGQVPGGQPLSDKEVSRRERMERRLEKKRQKAELARISREMRSSSKANIIWGTAITVGMILLVFGTYAFWCFYSVKVQRNAFEPIYENADQDMLRTFAPLTYARIQKLKASAEQGNMFLNTKEVCENYRKATMELQAAIRDGDDARTQYRQTRAAFEKLWEEARRNRLDQYTPDLWRRIVALRNDAGNEQDANFNSEQAVTKLQEATGLLEELSRSLPAIAEFVETYQRFTKSQETFVAEEWSRNLTDQFATLQAKLRHAEADRRINNWSAASAKYTEAVSLINEGTKALQDLRQTAAKAMSEFSQALATADSAELMANVRESWNELGTYHEQIKDAFRDYEYRLTVFTAEKAMKLLEEMERKIGSVRTSRDQSLNDLMQVFEEASRHTKFLRLNFQERWSKLELEYNNLQTVARGGTHLALLQTAGELRERIALLLQDSAKLAREAQEATESFETTWNEMDRDLVAANFPGPWTRLLRVRNTAERAMDRGHLQDALKDYASAKDRLTAVLARLQEVKQQTLSLHEQCQKRRSEFSNGIRRFRTDTQREIDRLLALADVHMQARNYSLALPVLQELQELLPEARHTFEQEGTVIDNITGVMWVRDGDSPGCFGGKTANWYHALQWVSTLTYAGYSDWVLPTEEDLQLLLKIPEAELERIFPNNRKAIYWTRVPAHDVDNALAIDFSARRTVVRELKVNAHYVRPMRMP